jgi:hypothetical protein
LTIAFLTLFFGLISGPCPVELRVDGPAAAIEISVDGHAAAHLAAPPWKARVDFGRDLLPHRIEARALDGAGHELGRTVEWVNLPHSTTKVDLELEGGSPPKAARVLWRDLMGGDLNAISLRFDDQPVKLDGQGRGVLPPHDLKSIHILTAQVDLKPDRSVRREVAYGGGYGSEVSTDLTGVPVEVRSGRLPAVPQLGGWLTANGKPLSVDAVEEGPGKLYVVYTASGFAKSDQIWTRRSLGHAALGFGGEDELRSSRAIERESSPQEPPRFEMRLGRQDEIHILPAVPQRFASSGELSDLFQPGPPLDYTMGGLPWLLAHTRMMASAAPRIADAVASAGLAAVDGNRRRAVLLFLSGDEKDASHYDAAQVRRFLAALRVPFFAWSLNDPQPGSTAAAWGAVKITTYQNLSSAVDRIRDELDSQRIVLVDGRHLPQSITLTPAAKRIELAGAAPPAP